MGFFSNLFGSSDADDQEDPVEEYIGDSEARENIVEFIRKNPGIKMLYGTLLIWCREENGPVYTAPSNFNRLISHDPPIEPDEPDPDHDSDWHRDKEHIRSIRRKLDENFIDYYTKHDRFIVGQDSFLPRWNWDDETSEYDTEYMEITHREDELEIKFKQPISGEYIEDPESVYTFTSPIDIPSDESMKRIRAFNSLAHTTVDDVDISQLKINIKKGNQLDLILNITVFEHRYHHPDLRP